MPFPLFLALKYLKPKRSVTSVITFVAVVGVMLGVAAMITVRSVFNGFGSLWDDRLIALNPHITITPPYGAKTLSEPEAIAEKISAVPGVTGVTPQISSMVMVRNRKTGAVQVPALVGVDPDAFTRVYAVGAPFEGTFDLYDGPYCVLLGVDLARKLGVWVGDRVQIGSVRMLEKMMGDNARVVPVLWKVTGIFDSRKYDFDAGVAIVSLPAARELLGMTGAEEIVVKTSAHPRDRAAYDPIVQNVRAAIGNREVTLQRWHEGAKTRRMLDALAVERNMTTLLMALITVVAVFCVMNTLLVLTVQKTPEIGLLKALRFPKRKIMGVFLIHGMIQCLIGTVLGIALAFLILENLDNIIAALNAVGFEVFPKAVYGLGGLPYRVDAGTVLLATSVALVSGLFSSIVPSFLAASKKPVEALNHG